MNERGLFFSWGRTDAAREKEKQRKQTKQETNRARALHRPSGFFRAFTPSFLSLILLALLLMTPSAAAAQKDAPVTLAPSTCAGWENAGAAVAVSLKHDAALRQFQEKNSASFHYQPAQQGVLGRVTNEASITCHGFSSRKIPKNREIETATAIFSFAATAAKENQGVLVIEASYDAGRRWQIVDSLAMQGEVSNRTHEGYWQFPIAEVARETLDQFSLRARYVSGDSFTSSTLLLDGVALDIRFAAPRQEAPANPFFSIVQQPVIVVDEKTLNEVEFLSADGERIDLPFSSETVNGKTNITVKPGAAIKPGTYILRTKSKKFFRTEVHEQRFSFGVATMNTSKSSYGVGDLVHFAIGVLDDHGRTVCDAKLNLTVTKPDGQTTSLSTADGSIASSAGCGPESLTDQADYSALLLADQGGTFQTQLEVVSASNPTVITGELKVDPAPLFRIERLAPTRINPRAQYVSRLHVTPSKAYKGTVRENLSQGFSVSEISEGGSAIVTDGHPAVQWTVDWQEGTLYELAYTFDAPDVSPAVATLGPLLAGDFIEPRRWAISSDEVVKKEKDDMRYETPPIQADDFSPTKTKLVLPSKPSLNQGETVHIKAFKRGYHLPQGEAIEGLDPAKPVTVTNVEVIGPNLATEGVLRVSESFRRGDQEFEELHLVPGEGFRPGLFRISSTYSDGATEVRRDEYFAWGVVALNTLKSVYSPNETVDFALGAVDAQGNTVCDAPLVLTVTSPSGTATTLSAANGTIARSSSCGPTTVTNTPDYSAQYTAGGAGDYALAVTTTIGGRAYTVNDTLFVRGDIPFAITRKAPTRLYPQADYDASFSVRPHSDYQGTFEERLPLTYDVVTVGQGGSAKKTDKETLITWPVDWQAGQTYELSYRMNPEDKSPARYELGPAKVGDLFTEYRPWVIASDAVGETHLLSAGDTTNLATSYTTASISPTANRLVIACIFTSRVSPNLPDDPTLSGNGLTWAEIGTVTFGTTTTPLKRLTMFRAMGASPSSGAVTVNYTNQHNGTAWSIFEFGGVDTSGSNGSGAVVQSQTNRGDAQTSLTVTLGAFSSVHNSTAGCFGANAGTLGSTFTFGNGFGEIADTGYDSPFSRLQSEWVAANDTTVDASFSTADAAGIAIEIKHETVDVSGNLYSNETPTAIDCSAANKTVKLYVNGSDNYSATCSASSGAYDFPAVALDSADVLTVYIDGASEDAVTVTRANNSTSAIGSLFLYQNRVAVTHEDSGPITNANLDNWDNGNDTDIPFTVTSNALTVNASTELHVVAGKTYTPGGTVTTDSSGGDLHVLGTATIDTASSVIGGDITIPSAGTLNINADTTINGGDITVTSSGALTTTSGTPTVTMGASGTIGGTGNITFYNLTTSGSITTTMSGSGTNAVNNNLTAAAGTTLNLNSSIAITGSLINTTTGIIGTSAGTPTVTVSGSSIGGGSGAITIYNLTKAGSGTTTFSGSGTNTISHDVSVSAGTFTNSNTITVTNDVAVSSGATYNINSHLNVNGGDLTNAGTGVINQTIGGPTVTVAGTGSIGGVSGSTTFLNLTLSGTPTFASDITVKGNLVLPSSVTAGSTTLTMTGVGTALGGGGATINNLTIDPSSTGSVTLTLASLTVSGTLTVAAGDTFSINSNPVLSVTGSAITWGDSSSTISGAGTLRFTDTSAGPGTGGTITSVVRYDASSANIAATTADARTYGGAIQFYANSGSARTITLPSGTMDFDSTMSLEAAGAGTLEVSGATNDPAYDLEGNFSMTAGNGVETFTTGSGNWNAAASVNLTNGTYTTEGTHKLIMDGTGTLTSDNETLLNLDINSSGTVTLAAATHTMTGNLLLGGSGTPTVTSSTISMTGSGKTIDGGGKTLNNLTLSNDGTTTLQNSNLTVSGTLNVTTSDTLSINSGITLTHTGGTFTFPDTATISGSGTLIFTDTSSGPGTTGTLSAVVRFDATAADVATTTVDARTYGGAVEFYSNVAATRSITMPSGTFVFSSNVTVTTGSSQSSVLTLDASNGGASNPTIGIGGNLTYSKGGSATPAITTGTGTWTVTGNVDLSSGTFTATSGHTLKMDGTTKNLTSNAQSLRTLQISGTVSMTDATTVATALTVDDSKALTINSGITATLSANSGTSLSLNTSGTINGPGRLTYQNSATTFPTGGTLAATLIARFDTVNGNMIIPARLDYGAVEAYGASANARTVTLGTAASQTITTSSYLYVIADAAASNDVTLQGATNDPTLNVGGDFDFTGTAGATEIVIAPDVAKTWTVSGNVNLTDGTWTPGAETLAMSGTSKTFTPAGNSITSFSETGGSVTMSGATDVNGDLTISGGTLTAPSAMTIGGSFDNDAAFTHSSGSVTFDATSGDKTIDADGTGAEAFYNLTFNDGGGSAQWNLGTTMDVDNTLTITGGTLSVLTNNITIGGNYDNDDTLLTGANTVTFDATTGTKTIDARGLAAPDFYNVTFNDGGNNATWQLESALDANNNLTITGGNLDTKSGANFQINVGGNWSNADTFTAQQGTVIFDQANFINTPTIDSTGAVLDDFYNITFSDSSANVLFILESPLDVNNNLLIDGQSEIDVKSTENNQINVAGNWTDNAFFDARSGTVILDGTSQQTLTGSMTGSSAFNNLTVTNSSGSDPDSSPSVIFGAAATTAGTFTAATANSKLRFNAGSTYIFQNINFNGQATGTRVFLRSSSSGTQWNLNVAGTRTVSNTDVKDSYACGQAPNIDASDGTNYDSGNNSCWTINTLTVSLDTNSAALGTLVTSTINKAPVVLTVTTNAQNGFTSYVYYNNKLRIDVSNDIDDEAGGGTIVAGTEEFGVSTSESTAVDIAAWSPASCSTGATTSNATALTTSAKSFATATSSVASDTTTLCFEASVTTTTVAGSYSSTATIVTAAKF